MKPRQLLFLFLGVLTLLRLVLIAVVELSPDETYYYQWSRHLDVCYFSKGPGVAVAIWLGTHVFGPTAFGVRVLSPFLALGTSLIMFSFARRLYGESVAIWTVITLSMIPMFEVGGLVMTIDPLSMFFWMAGLYTFWLALDRAPEWSMWWPATGAMIGLGFLCKWTNAMQLLSIVLLLASVPRHRQEFLRSGFRSMILVFLLFLAPPLIWNANHDWVTFTHLTMRGHLNHAFKFQPGQFLKFLGLHFGVYSPLIFGGMLTAIWWGWDRARVHFKPRFLLAFALPLLVMYAWISFGGATEPNWTAPASLSLGLLAVALWHEVAQEKKWARQYSVAALTIGLGMSLVVMDTDILRQFGFPLPYDSDPSSRTRGWETTAQIVEDFRKEFETKISQKVFLIGDKYQTASELAFYMQNPPVEGPGHPPVYTPESPAFESQYSFWPRYDESTEFTVLAQNYLSSPADPSADPKLREDVRTALSAIPKDEKSESSKMADAKRNLVHALRLALPNLPLDESFVEEGGPNLFTGRTALYITDRPEEKAPSTIQGGFEHADMIKCIDIKRHGLLLRQIRIFACYNYHGMSL